MFGQETCSKKGHNPVIAGIRVRSRDLESLGLGRAKEKEERFPQTPSKEEREKRSFASQSF